MVFMAIVSAVLGAVIGFCATGFGAAALLTSILGARDGGPGMSGFFFFGPIGGIAGALLGMGLVLRFGGGSAGWGRGLMISAGVLTLLGGALLAMTAFPDRGPSYSYVIEFQLKVPAAALAGVDIPSDYAMWGAAGAELDDKPISKFFAKECEGDTCVIGGSVAAYGPMNNFRIATAIGQKKARYPLDVPAVVNSPVDWSGWRDGADARVRWRIVQR
jgi:hypothetical protein